MDQFLAKSVEIRSAQKKKRASSAKPKRKLGAVKLRALDEENVPGNGAGLENIESVKWTGAAPPAAVTVPKTEAIEAVTGKSSPPKLADAKDIQQDVSTADFEQSEENGSKKRGIEGRNGHADLEIKPSKQCADDAGECCIPSPSGLASQAAEKATAGEVHKDEEFSACPDCKVKENALRKATVSLIEIAVELSHGLVGGCSHDHIETVENVCALLKITAPFPKISLESKMEAISRSVECLDPIQGPAGEVSPAPQVENASVSPKNGAQVTDSMKDERDLEIETQAVKTSADSGSRRDCADLAPTAGSDASCQTPEAVAAHQQSSAMDCLIAQERKTSPESPQISSKLEAWHQTSEQRSDLELADGSDDDRASSVTRAQVDLTNEASGALEQQTAPTGECPSPPALHNTQSSPTFQNVQEESPVVARMSKSPPADRDETSEEEFHSPAGYSDKDNGSEKTEDEVDSRAGSTMAPQGIWDLEDEEEEEFIVPSSIQGPSCQAQVPDTSEGDETVRNGPTDQPNLAIESEDDLTPKINGVRNRACNAVLVSESEDSLSSGLPSADKDTEQGGVEARETEVARFVELEAIESNRSQDTVISEPDNMSDFIRSDASELSRHETEPSQSSSSCGVAMDSPCNSHSHCDEAEIQSTLGRRHIANVLLTDSSNGSPCTSARKYMDSTKAKHHGESSIRPQHSVSSGRHNTLDANEDGINIEGVASNIKDIKKRLSFNKDISRDASLGRQGQCRSPIILGSSESSDKGCSRSPSPCTDRQRVATPATNNGMHSPFMLNTGTRTKNKAANIPKDFKKCREKLTAQIFSKLCAAICPDMVDVETLPVKWSKSMRTTSGITKIFRQDGVRRAEIQLSTHVVDEETRLWSTLAHELCHATSWIVDGVAKPPHGKTFRKWATVVERCFPDIKVTTCHTYSIRYRYQYQCTNPLCQQVIGRHSRSIDTDKQRCGLCHSKFEMIQDTDAKTNHKPNEYNNFVKENIARVKAEAPKGTPMKSIMKQIGTEWSAQNARRKRRVLSPLNY